MINKLARKWIDELKSGKYKKTIGSLRNKSGNKSYGYCCLGVACKLVEGTWKNNCFDSGELSSGELSTSLMNRFGLTPNSMEKLVSLNDDEGYSLVAIGKELEKNPKAYFQTKKQQKLAKSEDCKS